MIIDTYNIRLYKNNSRILPSRLNGADARLFFLQLRSLLRTYETRYGESLSEESLLTVVDTKEIYRARSKLKEAGIETIGDMLEYLGIDKPTYLFANNMIVTDTSLKLSDIYVLQCYSSWTYLTDGQLHKIGTEVKP